LNSKIDLFLRIIISFTFFPGTLKRLFIYLTPSFPLSFKGEGEEKKEGLCLFKLPFDYYSRARRVKERRSLSYMTTSPSLIKGGR